MAKLDDTLRGITRNEKFNALLRAAEFPFATTSRLSDARDAVLDELETLRKQVSCPACLGSKKIAINYSDDSPAVTVDCPVCVAPQPEKEES